MPSLKDRLRDTAEKLRGLGGPADALEKRVQAVIERATSDMMINPDWGVNMELVDIINSERSPACYDKVFKAIRRRLWKSSPKIQMLSLTLLETCVKNTGTEFHAALCTSEFWDEVLRLADPKRKTDLEVVDKVLVLVEDCAHALQPEAYKTAYDTLKSWGVRFPTRDRNDIGAGFNLPPPSASQGAAPAEVSEADQRAIQEALREFSSQPQAPVVPVQTAPPVTESDVSKIKSDLRVVFNTIEVLQEALSSISSNEPELVHQEYITDIRQQCVEILPKLKHLINTTEDESVLSEALYLNDELRATLSRYDQLSENARTGAIGVIEEEPELLNFEEEESVQNTNLSSSMLPVAKESNDGTLQNTESGAQVDQFAQLASGREPIKTATIDPFEELASHTPTGSTSQATVTPTTSTNNNRNFQSYPPQAPPPPAPPQTTKEQDPFDDLIKF